MVALKNCQALKPNKDDLFMADLLPLSLQSTPGSWRLFVIRRQDKNFQGFMQRIWERDEFTCKFCGFQAQKFQEVINLDSNYLNNKLPNMVTACCFCTQCHFLEAVGKSEYGGGTLIYLPELQQHELNALCHVLFCAIANASDYREDAQSIYRDLKMRNRMIEDKIGAGMSDPATFGQLLLDMDTVKREKMRQQIAPYVRLLPSRSRFKMQIDTWASEALAELSKEETTTNE